jgi:hypothetical protein
MSTTVPTYPDVCAELDALRRQLEAVRRLIRRRSRSDPSLTIDEFCALEGFSRAFYYGTLKREGRAPNEMVHSPGCVRISDAARRRWHRECEARTAPAATMETEPA